jgi:hypothetical protein
MRRDDSQRPEHLAVFPTHPRFAITVAQHVSQLYELVVQMISRFRG